MTFPKDMTKVLKFVLTNNRGVAVITSLLLSLEEYQKKNPNLDPDISRFLHLLSQLLKTILGQGYSPS